jgi:hypothetical protein
MDKARWWNTQGVLGKHGSTVYSRGFSRTHPFVRARVVFSVAQARCKEVFDPPGSITLWSLPAEIEDEFDSQWESWLDDADIWAPFFTKLESLPGKVLMEALREAGLISADQIAAVSKMRRSAEGRAVPISGTHDFNDDLITLLAAGFSLGEPGSPAIPYLKMESLRM